MQDLSLTLFSQTNFDKADTKSCLREQSQKKHGVPKPCFVKVLVHHAFGEKQLNLDKMYNHRKLKSSFFLRDDLYPEKILSKHKHFKKSGLYAILKSKLLPSSSVCANTFDVAKNSKMLLEEIPKLYLNDPLGKEKENTHTTSLAKISGNEKIEGEPIIDSKTHSLYCKPLVYNEKEKTGRKTICVKRRGLQEMGASSFTNGLLDSGHRYFRIL